MGIVIPIPCEEKTTEGEYILRTFEITEEEVKERLKGFECRTFTSLSGVDILFRNEKDWKEAKEILKEYVYTEKPESIEETLGRVLKERGFTLSTAESCTAGMLSSRIVNVPGSSEYFIGGFVVYSNDLKVKYLCVNEETLKKYGAVSWQTCLEMTVGLKSNLGTDCGVAITGIAGPGGTLKKPQGLTYIGIFVKDKITVIKRVFKGSRNENRFLSTQTAMFYLLRLLKR
ncbi:MAG: CinA family protein [Aquifex sp.]|nr:MAG: CinA family protein [Aquifex sp.]